MDWRIKTFAQWKILFSWENGDRQPSDSYLGHPSFKQTHLVKSTSTIYRQSKPFPHLKFWGYYNKCVIYFLAGWNWYTNLIPKTDYITWEIVGSWAFMGQQAKPDSRKESWRVIFHSFSWNHLYIYIVFVWVGAKKSVFKHTSGHADSDLSSWRHQKWRQLALQ